MPTSSGTHTAVLRQRRLARHVGAGRRRGVDESSDPQRRSAAVADGPVVEVTAHTATLAHQRSKSRMSPWRRCDSPMGPWGSSKLRRRLTRSAERIEIHGSEGSAVLEEEDLKTWALPRRRPATKRCSSGWPARRRPAAGRPTRPPSDITTHGDVRGRAEGHPQRLPAADRWARRTPFGGSDFGDLQAADTGRSVALPLSGDPALKAKAKR